MKRLAMLMACACAVTMGCGGAPDEGEGEWVTQTIIRFAPDGRPTQETRRITVAEQRAQIEARDAYVAQLSANGGAGVSQQANGKLVIDGSCAGADLWLFDQTSLQGNQLCLYRDAAVDPQGWLDLGTVLRFIPPGLIRTWAGAVRSLYSGVDPGALQVCTSTLCYSSHQSFNAWQRLDTVVASPPPPTGLSLNWAYLYAP